MTQALTSATSASAGDAYDDDGAGEACDDE
jgi:hypothetical protein